MISGTSAATDSTAISSGCRWTTPAQRDHMPGRPVGLGRRNAGSASRLIRGPSSPRKAGSREIATRTAHTTAIAEARPRALTRGIPATPSESNAMTTVQPAKTMALPDVATALAIDSGTGTPSRSWSWCRVMRNNA